MSKALELLANIDKKYNNELKNTEEQLLSGIEQTSQTIRDSLNTRANITATAIQQSDEKVAQSIQNSAQTVEKQLNQYQALLQSKLSRITQLNEQIQSQEQQAQNQAVQKKTTILNMGLISAAVILLIAIFSLGFVSKNKYSEVKTLNTMINEKQMRVDHLNKSGGSLNISTCKNLSNNKQRLCVQINTDAGSWQNGYMVPMGYYDDRIRNAIIENHRRTTATITATTSAIAEATASFRHNANQDYPSLVSSIKGNRERSAKLTASTEIISDNTDTISRARTQYSKLYRADQWQSPRDDPDHSQQRGSSGENLNHTAFSLVRSSQSSEEFARNIRDIEKYRPDE